jgi:YbbR domain-containing protein
MIAFLRHLFLDDILLKLFSLALAILIWVTVSFASQKEAGTARHVFRGLPVTVLSSTDDVRNFKVSPGTVELTVQGDATTVQNLQSKDLLPFVDLSGVATARYLLKRIDVAVPPGVMVIRMNPAAGQIIFPPER